MQNDRFGTRLTHWAALLGLTGALALTGSAAWAGGNIKPDVTSNNFDYYLSGSPIDQAQVEPSTQMTVLMGGSYFVDQAFHDMIAHAGGSQTRGIDIVVLSASNYAPDNYNGYLSAMEGVDSVETLVIKNSAGANDPFVKGVLEKADMVFIDGGDQWDFINGWDETEIEKTLRNTLLPRKVPIGGISAGMAVLGRVDFSAENGSITSTDALANPMDRRITLDTRFLDNIPGLQSVITDTHLARRDRMGRLVTFMSRIGKDGTGGLNWLSMHGIGVEQGAALVIRGDQAQVRYQPDAPDSTQSVYFLNWLQDPGSAITIQYKTPLTIPSSSIQVQKLSECKSCSFDLTQWKGRGTVSYQLSVTSGVLTSSQNGGSAY